MLGKRCCDGDGTTGVILPGEDLDEDDIAQVKLLGGNDTEHLDYILD